MKSIKKNIVISIVVLLVAPGFLFITAPLYSADPPDLSSFMDLESSIKALRLKVEKARRSIVMIIAYDDTGTESGRGSGLFIDNEGRIITNALVMQEAYSAEVFIGPDHYKEVIILNRREDLDLALIQVKATNVTPFELDFESEVKPGERVIVVGKSSRLDTTVSEGLISNISSIGETIVLVEIETTRPLLSYRPSKDGSVINMDGKLIGITTSVISNTGEFDTIPMVYYGEKLNAIIIRSIKPMLAHPGNVEHLYPPRTHVWSRWFIYTIKTAAISAFIALYSLGFLKIMAIFFAFIVLVSLIQWLYSKLIRSGK